MHKLAYKLQGKKIDSNKIKISNDNILWHSALEINDILKIIKNVQNLENKYNINININIFESKNKDWIECYKQSVQPVICGDFYIRPSWHDENKQYTNIIIDPSLSFGSGHHPSTIMCVKHLQSLNLKNKNVLDIGCGSGILSIVASKLGANVDLCDTDIESINQSKNNFSKNNAQYKNIWHGSINHYNNEENTESKNTKLTHKEDEKMQYDAICANLTTSILLLLKNDMFAHLKDHGTLILSGILKDDLEKVKDDFMKNKCAKLEVLTMIDDEWGSLKITKN